MSRFDDFIEARKKEGIDHDRASYLWIDAENERVFNLPLIQKVNELDNLVREIKDSAGKETGRERLFYIFDKLADYLVDESIEAENDWGVSLPEESGAQIDYLLLQMFALLPKLHERKIVNKEQTARHEKAMNELNTVVYLRFNDPMNPPPPRQE